jgi:predicted O-linked N-acetylglucosamine transferase (SPINDLY family)
MAGIFESHDLARFDVNIYDYSVDSAGPLRARVIAASKNFHRIRSLGPVDCALLIKAHCVDILVDLQGYTDGSRSEILALRPAPIQINFLGYVGTQGAPWIDFVIADEKVLPLTEKEFWQERIMHLPHSYYPSDRSRPIPGEEGAIARFSYGLPADAFVFACFNNNYKITPTIFSAWMTILRRAPSSVLWLLEGNHYVSDNLRREAKIAGVDPIRLFFAPRTSFDDHIKRHAAADVFLDTSPYSAHTTGVDALWASLPVITLRGRTFASRVGSSLLHTVGLNELVCDTLERYVDLACKLSQSPNWLKELKVHLVNSRTSSPLFDVSSFTSDLEKIFVHCFSTEALTD